jgi:hypothetical protein
VLGVEDTSPWVAYARTGGIMTLRRVMPPGPVYYLYDPWPDHEIESGHEQAVSVIGRRVKYLV